MALARDITDLKASEEALTTSEARYRTFFENSCDAMKRCQRRLLSCAEEAGLEQCELDKKVSDYQNGTGNANGLTDTSAFITSHGLLATARYTPTVSGGAIPIMQDNRIFRPRQEYMGTHQAPYIPMDER